MNEPVRLLRDGHVADPMFTVAIVCLNAEKHLSEALDSVLSQTPPGGYELVVVDGGSTDGTLEVLRAYEARFGGRLRWQSEPDEGLYDAMNKALESARGEYVVYIGADDRLSDGALARVAQVVSADAPDIVCGSTLVFSTTDSWIERTRPTHGRGLPRRAPSRHQSIYVRRARLVQAGGFRTSFRIAADYDLYVRLRALGASEAMVADVLSEFRLGGVSSADARATAREYRDVRVANGANAALERIVMLKALFASRVFSAWRRLVGGAR